jgi:transcription elongation GreA/GreB family factor
MVSPFSMSPDAAPEPVVRSGPRVHYRDHAGEQRVVLIRCDDPESWATDSLSAHSPLGRALLGHRAGDEVEVVLHAAVPTRRVTIDTIG